MYDYFRGNPEGRNPLEFLTAREPIRPEYRDRDARLAVMDEQGVDKIWLFPTLGMLYEEPLRDDPEAVALTFSSVQPLARGRLGIRLPTTASSPPRTCRSPTSTGRATERRQGGRRRRPRRCDARRGADHGHRPYSRSTLVSTASGRCSRRPASCSSSTPATAVTRRTGTSTTASRRASAARSSRASTPSPSSGRRPTS